MSKIKEKAKPVLKESLSVARDFKEVIEETSWDEFVDAMADDPYMNPSRVELRGRIRRVTAIAAGALAVGAAATGRRKWAAGLAVYAAGQEATQLAEEKISQHRSATKH